MLIYLCKKLNNKRQYLNNNLNTIFKIFGLIWSDMLRCGTLVRSDMDRCSNEQETFRTRSTEKNTSELPMQYLLIIVILFLDII